MPGLKGEFKGPSTGVTEKIGNTLESVIRYLHAVQRFSAHVGEALTALMRVEMLHGQTVSVVVRDPNVVPYVQFFPHGLGRPFKGVSLRGQSFPYLLLTTLDPAMVSAWGQDPAKVFGVWPIAVANADITATFWVY